MTTLKVWSRTGRLHELRLWLLTLIVLLDRFSGDHGGNVPQSWRQVRDDRLREASPCLLWPGPIVILQIVYLFVSSCELWAWTLYVFVNTVSFWNVWVFRVFNHRHRPGDQTLACVQVIHHTSSLTSGRLLVSLQDVLGGLVSFNCSPFITEESESNTLFSISANNDNSYFVNDC